MKRFCRWGAVCGLVLLASCGDDDEPATPVEVEVPAEPTHQGTPSYVVHEWGLIGDGADGIHPMYAGRLPPFVHFEGVPRDRRHLGSIGKPVLYVHLDPGTEAVTFSARVEVGPWLFVVEHFPPGAPGLPRSVVEWPEVTARRGPCSEPVAYPSRGSDACRQVRYCEAAELARYETDDGACLEVGGAQYDHLFYRASASLHLPVTAERGVEEGHWTLTTSREVPGRMLRVVRAQNAADTLVSIHDPPLPGAPPFELSPPTERGAEAGVRALRDGLTGLGLTDDEASAFMRAWRVDLFGESEGVDAPSPVGEPPADLTPRLDALIYWLPTEVADEAATLTFSPPPREVRRAILMVADLDRLGDHAPHGEPQHAESQREVGRAERPQAPRSATAP